MTQLPDHYAALGIDPTADQEVITAAYRALAKKFHPDTGASTGTASPARFEEVQRAYEVLRTPESRHDYDLALLEQTERELAEHLASRSRIVPRAEAPGQDVPPPDLGRVRPAAARGGPTPATTPPRKPRSILPFLVPVLLLLAAGGAALFLFLPQPVEAPPPPVLAETPPAKVSAPPAAQPADQPPAEPPLFGSSVTDAALEAAPDAPAATAAPAPAPAAAPAPDNRPLFGSTATDAALADPPPDPAEDAPAEAPPVPKPRPVHAAATPAAPPAKPKVQAQPQPQPQRIAPPPQRFAMEEGPYRLVIFERFPGEDATAWRAGVLFDSRGSCTQFGTQSVLRRLALRDPENADSKIWYECQPAG